MKTEEINGYMVEVVLVASNFDGEILTEKVRFSYPRCEGMPLELIHRDINCFGLDHQLDFSIKSMNIFQSNLETELEKAFRY